jgi:hypothetical protein
LLNAGFEGVVMLRQGMGNVGAMWVPPTSIGRWRWEICPERILQVLSKPSAAEKSASSAS